jgi:hypothetical protein
MTEGQRVRMTKWKNEGMTEWQRDKATERQRQTDREEDRQTDKTKIHLKWFLIERKKLWAKDFWYDMHINLTWPYLI